MSENPFDVQRSPSSTVSAQYCQKTVEQTVEELRTDLTNGLSNHDIISRRSLYGINELRKEEEASLPMKFLANFYEDPLILLLIGSAFISFLMGNVQDAVSITVAILIVVTVGFVQEYRSEKSLDALNKLVPAEATLTRNGNTSNVLASTLVPGDLVQFRQGDRIPADVRITSATYLCIDESNLTGETEPVDKSVEPMPRQQGEIPINERHSIAFMGTLVRDGHGEGIVVATGSRTEFGAVFEMMSEIEKPKTPLQRAMDKLGKELSTFSFIIIGIICLVGIFQGREWLEMFQISVSLAVAAIPEGLPIIVTVTLALGVLRMAHQKAIVKRLPSVETLGSVNVICSDKTGTLTQNHMTATKAWAFDYAGSFNTPFLEITKISSNNLEHELSSNLARTFEAGNICNNAKYSSEEEKWVGNPSDISLVECLKNFGLEDVRGRSQKLYELPFSSNRKYMAVCVHYGNVDKALTFAKGATERIIKLCSKYYNEEGEIRPLKENVKETILARSKELASEGLRVLAIACNNLKFVNTGTEIKEPTDLVFCGLVGINDPPRPLVGNSISLLMKGGVHVIMITGDAPSTAANIAKQVGIPVASDDAVLTGDRLEALDEEALAEAIHNVSVFARTTPEHKVKIVKALQRRGDVVAMTGDGVNDAPALKLADIGIAMGKQGTDVAKEAADMVLVDDDFSTILNAIKEGKGIFYNIQNFITFQLSTSIAALTLIALSTIFGLPNPLNAMQILWINILMDGPPAQSLGVEPVDPEVMNQPPRERNSKILTSSIIKRVILSAAIIILGTLYIFIKEMKDDEVTARDTTMTFTCFVLFDMFNALSCRQCNKSIFEVGLKNQMFNYAVLGSLLGQLCAIYVPFFQSVFQTEALTLKDLFQLLLLTSSVFFVDEIRKFYIRSTNVYGNRYHMGV